MGKFKQNQDKHKARVSRIKAGKRRKGKAVAIHCQLCHKRPSAPGSSLCVHCHRMPFCAGIHCRHRVELAGDLCAKCKVKVFA